jgi:magnesium-protoporphyrin IX monomethyl ester (oxidative) cyclase
MSAIPAQLTDKQVLANAAAGGVQFVAPINSAADALDQARADSLISPKFYTTDFAAMDRVNVSSVRAEWDQLMSEFRGDSNKDHFERDDAFGAEVMALPEGLRDEFFDFLISSATSEYSGCVLYADIRSNVKNPEMRELMGFMARDESRHSGFINRALKDFNVGLDLPSLRKTKAYTFFKPKFIFYATYLSEKIGYARYITIHRNLEQHPERRFHPIFRWFEQWCLDEFRHGEAFAVLMKADPKLQSGINKLWIRFFLLAVFATMYVRDHTRPHMFNALGLKPDEFGFAVFRITTDISRQIFPVSLDIDHPAFRAGLESMRIDFEAAQTARAQGGLIGKVKLLAANLRIAKTFISLYLRPVNHHALPDDVRVVPVW